MPDSQLVSVVSRSGCVFTAGGSCATIGANTRSPMDSWPSCWSVPAETSPRNEAIDMVIYPSRHYSKVFQINNLGSDLTIRAKSKSGA